MPASPPGSALAVEAKNLDGHFAIEPYFPFFILGAAPPNLPPGPNEAPRKTKFVYHDINSLIADMKRDRRERY